MEQENERFHSRGDRLTAPRQRLLTKRDSAATCIQKQATRCRPQKFLANKEAPHFRKVLGMLVRFVLLSIPFFSAGYSAGYFRRVVFPQCKLEATRPGRRLLIIQHRPAVRRPSISQLVLEGGWAKIFYFAPGVHLRRGEPDTAESPNASPQSITTQLATCTNRRSPVAGSGWHLQNLEPRRQASPPRTGF